MGRLTIIPTPIGNLEDITLRAIRLLREADIVLAEDTRTTQKLLRHFEISPKELRSHHMHNEHSTAKSVAEAIANGQKVVLVSDAGTPGISDPGFILVRECLQLDLKVECLPGATAFVPALVASGLPCDRFSFEGFLPQKKGRQTLLGDIAKRPTTTILYEAPTRLVKLLEQLSALLEPEREVVVVREISKLHEEYHRGKASELYEYFKSQSPRGEIVVLIAPSPVLERIHKNKYKES
ncbi:MAG: 16S rRNA (cytidine(1402)-2'-O)-methyltransferase [Porphyromonas sp.]|nr:16S rRNA (cytidine(1402)-2'-O)-methyltransferase [Porphyromonas sp.]